PPAIGTLAVTGDLTATGRTITQAGAGTAQLQNVRAAGLTVNAGAVSSREKTGAANSAAGTSVISALSIKSGTGAGTVDLTNNALILPYTSLGSLLSDTRQELLDGRLKTGLSAGGHALGYADNSTLGRSTFGGQPVTASN